MENINEPKNVARFTLNEFKQAHKDMTAKNETSWDSTYGGFHRANIHKLKEYTIEEVDKIINSNDPVALSDLSNNYFNKDGFYQRILVYYASLLKYQSILIPNPTGTLELSNKNMQKRYNEALSFLSKIGLQELFYRITLSVFINGSYYGLIQSIDKTGLVIIDLPTKYCKSRFKDLQGNDLIEFDLSYFDTIMDEQDRESALSAYPKFISKAYKLYAKRGGDRVIILPAEFSIFFSMFNSNRPPFLNVIPATIQYDKAVELEQERDLEEIRKIIVQKIPHLNDGTLVFEPDEAAVMHQGAVNMMKKNPNISILTSYADVDSIVSKTSSDSTNNNIEKMLNNVYSQANASQQLFSPTGSSSLQTSIRNDTAFVMSLVYKYNIFMSKILNRVFGNKNIEFNFIFLDITYYNESDYITDTFKLAQSGYSFLLPALASGISQNDLINLKTLENDVLKLHDKLLPLQSAYTQSANGGTPGAPELPEEKKSAKTIANEKSIDNQGQGGSN